MTFAISPQGRALWGHWLRRDCRAFGARPPSAFELAALWAACGPLVGPLGPRLAGNAAACVCLARDEAWWEKLG